MLDFPLSCYIFFFGVIIFQHTPQTYQNDPKSPTGLCIPARLLGQGDGKFGYGDHHGKGNTPPKFNMEPENDGFQEELPFLGTSFQVPCQFSGVYYEESSRIMDFLSIFTYLRP